MYDDDEDAEVAFEELLNSYGVDEVHVPTIPRPPR